MHTSLTTHSAEYRLYRLAVKISIIHYSKSDCSIREFCDSTIRESVSRTKYLVSFIEELKQLEDNRGSTIFSSSYAVTLVVSLDSLDVSSCLTFVCNFDCFFFSFSFSSGGSDIGAFSLALDL